MKRGKKKGIAFILTFAMVAAAMLSGTSMVFAAEADETGSEMNGSACTLTEGCTLENGHDGDCSVAETGSSILGEGNGAATAANLTAVTASSTPIVGTGYSFDSDTGILTVTENDGTTAWQGDFGADAIKEIVVESGVTRIGGAAFRGCANLTQVTLPEGLTEIGTSAFADCVSLTAITFPSSLTTIGEFAFDGCTSLTEVTLPGNLEEIGMYAFSDCTSLTTVTFTGTVAPTVPSATYDMFDGCTSLVAIYVPNGATGYDGGSWAQYSEKVTYGASLISLLISEGTLDPAFSAETYNYSVTVGSDVKTITITPTAQANETITVNGTSVASGSACEVSLGDGTTEIQIVVKGGSLTTTYTVAVAVTQSKATTAASSSTEVTTTASETDSSAQTGDDTNLVLWIALLLAAAAAGGTAIGSRRLLNRK